MKCVGSMAGRAMLLAAMITLGLRPGSSPAQSVFSSISKIPEDIHPRAAQAVVRITSGGGERTGAGIVIAKSRHGLPIILTANQLISEQEDQLTVAIEGQAQSVPAQLILPQWRNRELALIATRNKLPVAPALAYGRSDLLAPGDQVAVIGFPQSSYLSQNSGQVLRNGADQILLNFMLSQGQTGGPLVDRQGRVVGLAISRAGELGQAVPIELAVLAVDQWLAKTTLSAQWQEGRYGKPWYGWVLGVALLAATGVAVGLSGVL